MMGKGETDGYHNFPLFPQDVKIPISPGLIVHVTDC